MGCFDTILVPCPKCGRESEFQSKGGDCLLRVFKLSEAPADVMEDVNRHAPNTCEGCGTLFEVKFKIREQEVSGARCSIGIVEEAKSVIAESKEPT